MHLLDEPNQPNRKTVTTGSLKNSVWLYPFNGFSESIPSSTQKLFTRNEYAHVRHALSLVEDPLWRRVCADILALMGPMATQVFHVQLGIPQDKAIDLYCQTEEILLFLHTYQFVILTSLQRYFPPLRTLKIICKT